MSNIDVEITEKRSTGSENVDENGVTGFELKCKKEGRITGIRGECGQDYVLPDYMGDVKRLLRYSASVVPCNKFVSGAEVSFLGIVTFRVAYLDSENTLTEACFTADYEHSERVSDSVIDADVDSRVQSVTVRLGGPRKISARAALSSDISLTYEDKVSECASFPGAECRGGRIKIHSAEYVKCDEREYAEEIDRIEDVLADEIEVVKYDAAAIIDALHKTEGGVNLSGYVDAWCVLRVGDEIMRLERRIPIEEGISLDTSREGSAYTARGFVTGVNINVNNSTEEKDGGCAASIVMNATVECMLTHHYNEEYEVVYDAFCEGKENSCSYESFAYNELIATSLEKKKLSFVRERGEEIIHDVIEKELCVKNVKFDTGDGEISVSFDTAVTIVARGTEVGECSSVKLEESFTEKIKLPGVTPESGVRVSVTPCDVSPSFDANKIYIDMSVSVSAVAEESRSVKLLAKLACNDKSESDERCVWVYYPKKGDTLWSVAKKYAVRVEKIAKQNGITNVFDSSEHDLCGMNKIMIVK